MATTAVQITLRWPLDSDDLRFVDPLVTPAKAGADARHKAPSMEAFSSFAPAFAEVTGDGVIQFKAIPPYLTGPPTDQSPPYWGGAYPNAA